MKVVVIGSPTRQVAGSPDVLGVLYQEIRWGAYSTYTESKPGLMNLLRVIHISLASVEKVCRYAGIDK